MIYCFSMDACSVVFFLSVSLTLYFFYTYLYVILWLQETGKKKWEKRSKRCRKSNLQKISWQRLFSHLSTTCAPTNRTGFSISFEYFLQTIKGEIFKNPYTLSFICIWVIQQNYLCSSQWQIFVLIIETLIMLLL